MPDIEEIVFKLRRYRDGTLRETDKYLLPDNRRKKRRMESI